MDYYDTNEANQVAKIDNSCKINLPKTTVTENTKYTENTQKTIKHSKQENKLSKLLPKRGNILLLSDDQGKGVVQELLKNKSKFIINNYAISGLRKPDATTEEVLSCCHNLSKGLTKNDNTYIKI